MATDEASELRADLDRATRTIERLTERLAAGAPVPMLLYCPECGQRHVDAGDFATKVHTSHSCQSCGMTWRPAIVATVGVRFLPGFRDEEASGKPAERLVGLEPVDPADYEAVQIWPSGTPLCGARASEDDNSATCTRLWHPVGNHVCGDRAQGRVLARWPLVHEEVRPDPVGPVRTVPVVKSAPTPFQAVWDGLKRFEIRRNDRDYREGDALRLREWNVNLVKTTGLPNAELYGYTGREARARIIHYSVYEQKEGYCVLGLGEVARSEPDNKGERR